MTIPIMPGPLSFLGDVGGALGAIGQRKDEVNRQREELRRQQLAEARQQAQTYITLRMAGLMKPQEFSTPEVQAVLHSAGYGPVTAEETPDESLRGYVGNFIHDVISGKRPEDLDALRQMANIPGRETGPVTEAKIATAQAAVPQSQLAGMQAKAQIPQAELTAQAAQVGQQDKTFNDLADRYIEGLYARTNKLPASGADAFQQALADPRAAQFAQAMGQTYFDQAIERQRAKLYEEQTKRTAAAARAQGAAGGLTDDAIRALTAQQTRANQQLNSVTTQLDALKAPSSLDLLQSNMVESAKKRGVSPTAAALAAKQRVEEYNAQRKKLRSRADSLNTEINNLRDQMGGVLSPMLGTPAPAPRSGGTSPQQAAWDEAAAEIRRLSTGPGKYRGQTPEQVLGPRP